jgi:hypothetical protein
MKSHVVQLVLKVSPQSREKLRKFADEDDRNMSRTFERLMDLEAARRLESFAPYREDDVPGTI